METRGTKKKRKHARRSNRKLAVMTPKEADALAARMKEAYVRLRAQLPEVDPDTLRYVLERRFRPPGAGGRFFIHRRRDGGYYISGTSVAMAEHPTPVTKARKAHPDAEVILGQDYLRREVSPQKVRRTAEMSPADRRRIARQQWRDGWHHHALSPHCTDEVHGRFDAIRGEQGFEVLDVGAGTVAAWARSGIEAIEIAEALAAEWRPPFGRTKITNPYFERACREGITSPLNQCDGCRAGKPLEKGGMHRMGDGEYPDWMICQAAKYAERTSPPQKENKKRR